MIKGQCHCGRVSWTLDAIPKEATACNCTICRRYGALWGYGWFGQSLHANGETRPYQRTDGGAVDFHFCPFCGCLTHYIATQPEADGRVWSAANLRMAEPETVLHLPVRHFDGRETWGDLPRDARGVRDLWF